MRSPEDVQRALAGEGYLADRGLATAVHLAQILEQPLLLEGEAGVGKTEVARALAAATGARLIRLQCHEGIDLHHAVYDWDYARQLLTVRGENTAAAELFDLSHPPLDFVALAQGMGVPAVRAETADELVRELQRALAEPGPQLIDAILPARL